MKFFYKMFLGMTVILAVALGMIEYVTLSYSLEHAVKREQDSALSQHQMIKYSIETVILNMKSEDVDKELTDMMSQSAKSIVGDEGGMYLAADDGKRIYANSCNYEQKDIKVKDGTLTYSIVSKENTKDTGEKQSSRYIHVKSSFKLNDNRYILITESDITPVFDESKELRYRCSVYYIVILAVGMMVILILSWMITKPLAGLTATTKKFADGDYTARSDVKTKDEIGELAHASLLLLMKFDLDRACIGKLDGVVGEVKQDLVQGAAIGLHGDIRFRDVHQKTQPLRFCQRTQRGRHFFQHALAWHRLNMQFHLARFDLGEIKQVIDE